MIGTDPSTRTRASGTASLLLLLSIAATLFIATPASRMHWGPASFALTGLVMAAAVVAAAARRVTLPGRQLRPLQSVALGYAGLVAVAALVHGSALATLESSRRVAVGGATAAAALQALLEETPLHLGLPLALFASSVLVELRPAESWRRLRFLPWLLLPSALVALVQATVRLDLWNVSHFVLHRRASGLGYDANSLAACIFLLLPLLWLRAMQEEKSSQRIARAAYALLLVAVLAATGNRTALAGVVAVSALLPIAMSSVAPEAARRRRAALLLAPALLAVGSVVFFAAANRASDRLVGVARLVDAFERLRSDGAGGLFATSGRLELWQPALRIWAEAPIAGVGPGGYIRELSNVRFRLGEARGDEPVDHAASHYLQVASELGVIGLIATGYLLVVPTWRVARAARRDPDPHRRRSLAAIACTLAIALPLLQFNHYGLFPDVAWALALLLAFADASAVRGADRLRQGGRARRIAPAATLLLFAIASAATAFGRQGYEARASASWWPFRFDAGCHAVESWDGIPTRWCGPAAWLQVPVHWPGDRALALQLIAHHPDLAARPLEVRIGLVDGSFTMLHFDRPEWQQLSIPIAPSTLVPCFDDAGSRATCLAVRLESSRGWRPSESSASTDDRWLGIALRAKPIPDLSLLPGHLFSDDFEAGGLARWRFGEASGDEP